MDSLGRVIVLLGSDPMADKYPCVGIWVSGMNETKRKSKLALWASCFYYVTSNKIKRLSNTKDTLTFLTLIINRKVNFYEVNLNDSACWNLHTETVGTTNLNRSLNVCPSPILSSQFSSPGGLRTARFGETPSLDCSISDILSNSQSDVSYFARQNESYRESQDSQIRQLQDQITNLTNLIQKLPLVVVKTPEKCTIGTNTTFEAIKESPISPHSDSTRCYTDNSSPEESSFRSKSFWDSPDTTIPKILYNSRENTFEGL